MTVEELIEFIETKMTMNHVYQPVVIRALVETGGTATVRHLAQVLAATDEDEIARYTQTARNMPIRVLADHGVVTRDGDIVQLAIRRLSTEDRARVRGACERKLNEYIARHGDAIWGYKAMEPPTPGSLRWQVLAAAGQRCAVCGATVETAQLHVDHIIPRSRGGKTEFANLQALCETCNLGKSNRDETDFRKLPLDADPSCVFCGEEFRARAVQRNGTVYAVEDAFPVTEGHLLIVTARHCPDFFAMTDLEREHANELLRVLQRRLAGDDKTIVGFNVGTNCGEAAGQTMMHAHVHLIPRRRGDVDEPRGGVRGVVPERQSY